MLIALFHTPHFYIDTDVVCVYVAMGNHRHRSACYRSLYVSGLPGTGKSHTVRTVLDSIKQQKVGMSRIDFTAKTVSAFFFLPMELSNGGFRQLMRGLRPN